MSAVGDGSTAPFLDFCPNGQKCYESRQQHQMGTTDDTTRIIQYARGLHLNENSNHNMHHN